jgi:hypothetical protein
MCDTCSLLSASLSTLNRYLFIIFTITTFAIILFLSRTNNGDSVLQIYAWLDSLVETHPGVVTSIVGGQSYEDRQIKGVKVSFKAGNPVIILEGGMSSYPTTCLGFLLSETLKALLAK